MTGHSRQAADSQHSDFSIYIIRLSAKYCFQQGMDETIAELRRQLEEQQKLREAAERLEEE